MCKKACRWKSWKKTTNRCICGRALLHGGSYPRAGPKMVAPLTGKTPQNQIVPMDSRSRSICQKEEMSYRYLAVFLEVCMRAADGF